MLESSRDFQLQAWLEFKERRSFFGWIGVAFVMFAFAAARIGLVLPAGRKNLLPPGEYYAHKDMQGTLVSHVLAITLWSVLGVIQFVPHVRKVAIGYHRWAGRFYFLCSTVLTTTGLMLMPAAFGGHPCAIVGTCVLAILFIASAGMGFLRIRQRCIEEHRSWMLRNFAIGSSVIWIRLFVVIGFNIMSCFNVWTSMDCEQVLFELDNRDEMLEYYPLCQFLERVLVSSKGSLILNTIAGLRLSYGAGLWLGLIINMCCVELWIRRKRPEKSPDPVPQVEEEAPGGAAPGSAGGATAWAS